MLVRSTIKNLNLGKKPVGQSVLAVTGGKQALSKHFLAESLPSSGFVHTHKSTFLS